MARTLLSVAMALGLCLGGSLAAEEKKADAKKTTKVKKASVIGTVKKFNAATGALTLTVKVKGTKKKEGKATKEFKVPESAKIVVYENEAGKKELTGKEGFKEIKKGAKVTLLQGADGKVESLTLNKPKKVKKPKKKK